MHEKDGIAAVQITVLLLCASVWSPDHTAMLLHTPSHGCLARRNRGHALHSGSLRHNTLVASSKAAAQVTATKAEAWMNELVGDNRETCVLSHGGFTMDWHDAHSVLSAHTPQDELLQRADETDAVSLVSRLREQQFRGFGAARQVCR
jgi:hypothetical protein